jgi:hypothetical protein
MRFALLLLLAAAVAIGQGTDPKPKAEDYDVHAETPKGALGAESMVHSFSGQGQTYIAKDYLVIEVALYPPKDETIQVHSFDFSLRINGKTTLQPVSPSVVASALQHPDWQQQDRHVAAGAGVGNTSVILGRPTASRIPGGPEPQRLPRTSDPVDHSGIDREPRIKAEELVVQTALPEDPHRGPISGYIYFPYKGKPSAIKSLDLLFEGVSIKLR